MAKPGIFNRAPEWWRHLRSEKRTFWKAERKSARLMTDEEAALFDEAFESMDTVFKNMNKAFDAMKRNG